MTDLQVSRALTINSGSSSLKAASYEIGEKEALILVVEVDRVGIPGSRMRITDAHGTTLLDRQSDLPDHSTALQTFFTWFEQHDSYQGSPGTMCETSNGHHVLACFTPKRILSLTYRNRNAFSTRRRKAHKIISKQQ